jgi:hypothetical protein
MKCKVKQFHHSYHVRRDVEVGEVIDIPEAVIETNKAFYMPVHEDYVAPVGPKPDREKLEKEAIRLKLIKPEEVAGLSLSQIQKLVEGK